MTNEEQCRIFSKNLRYLLAINNKSQREVADKIGISAQTFNTWCQGIAIPRMGKIELLANYFNCNKSDLIDPKDHTSEDKYSIENARLLITIKNDEKLRALIKDYLSLPENKQAIVSSLVQSLISNP